MSRTISKRLLAQSPGTPSKLVPSFQLSTRSVRPFSQSSTRATEDGPSSSLSTGLPTRSPSGRKDTVPSMDSLANSMNRMRLQNNMDRKSSLLNTNFSSDGTSAPQMQAEAHVEPHHFHIVATRHNTHITLTDPKRNPIISLSCGNLGFRHSARKQYDPAFQLASHVMLRMQERGINAQIKELEVILRGFGAGREAVTKALLGLEGANLRHKIVKVADATRLKFGGTRSKKPRRLG